MGILTSDEMQDDDNVAAYGTLRLIADDMYNIDRPSHIVIKELVKVIRLFEDKLNILG